MIKENGRIIISKLEDGRLYNLVKRIEATEFGVIQFECNPIKEIRVRNKEPYQVITIERSTLLSED